MLGYNGELIQDEEVGGVCGRDVDEVQCFWRIFEWIDLLLRCSTRKVWKRLFGERRAIAQLELFSVSLLFLCVCGDLREGRSTYE